MADEDDDAQAFESERDGDEREDAGPKVKEPSGRTAQGGTRMAKYPPNALTPEMNKGHHRRGAPLSMKTSREGAVPAKGIND